jgi:hypothetical protein
MQGLPPGFAPSGQQYSSHVQDPSAQRPARSQVAVSQRAQVEGPGRTRKWNHGPPRCRHRWSPHHLDQLFANGQPRPVPPYFRMVEASAWVNGEKSRAALVRPYPDPRSVMSKRIVAAPSRWPSSLASNVTPPPLSEL